MTLFLSIYALIYAGLHLAVFLRVRALLPFPRWCWAIWAGLMILTPATAYFLDKVGWPHIAGVLAWAGFLWMGLMVISLFASLTAWAVQLLWWGLRRLTPKKMPALSSRALAGIVMAMAISLSLYGYFEARHPRLESITLTTSKLPAAKNSLRLVFIADLHLGLTSRLSYVKKVAALIQQARPHLILAGGDIVDGQGPVADQAAEILAGLKAPLGKFAVMGNHEAYVGLAYSQKFLNKCGFKVLRDQAQNVGGVLTLVGVDDRREGNPRQSELNLLKSVSSDRYTIFIRHRPWVSPGSLGHFDLQLSGHTHGGQIFPWSLAVKSFYSRYKGLYGLKDGAWLYVNRGSGTWGPPMRILTPPEVTLIELVSPKSRPLTAGTEAAKQAATE